MTTRIGVARMVGRQRLDLVGGLLRPQVVLDRPDHTRIGLVATTALLLGGDQVELEVELGPGAALELFDVAGTVAYHGRGQPASWRVRLWLDDRACLVYRGEPFVISDGADVERSLQVDAASQARLRLRETVILGRSGQRGGRVRSRTRVRVADRDVWREDTDLDPAGIRGLPGLLGEHRVIDTVLRLGEAPEPEPPAAAVTFQLVGGVGTLTRYLGSDLAASPLS